MKNMNTIKPLELSDRPLVMEYVRRYPPGVSELTFTNLFAWRHSRSISFACVEDALVFLSPVDRDERGASVIFGPPLGAISPKTVMGVFEPEVRGMVRIPKAVAQVLENSDHCVVEDRDNFDYVYAVADLAQLSGRRYHKKRNLIKQCLKNHSCQYEEITSECIVECLDMQDRWCELRDCGMNPGLCSEYQAIKETLHQYTTLELIGGAVRVDGVIQAYSVGEALSPQTAVCHFEKAMPGIQGLSQLINQWFAQHSLDGFEFVNREQDLGIPGLRQAKKSYYPHHLVPKFKAFPMSLKEAACSEMEPHECAKHIFSDGFKE
jgi:hypothetical protein